MPILQGLQQRIFCSVIYFVSRDTSLGLKSVFRAGTAGSTPALGINRKIYLPDLLAVVVKTVTTKAPSLPLRAPRQVCGPDRLERGIPNRKVGGSIPPALCNLSPIVLQQASGVERIFKHDEGLGT